MAGIWRIGCQAESAKPGWETAEPSACTFEAEARRHPSANSTRDGLAGAPNRGIAQRASHVMTGATAPVLFKSLSMLRATCVVSFLLTRC